MRHLPRQTYYALTGRQDRAGLLATPEQRLERQALQYPDARFWEERARCEAAIASLAIPAQVLNDALTLIEDAWFEAQTWLGIWRGWRRLLSAWRTNPQSDAVTLAMAMLAAPAQAAIPL